MNLYAGTHPADWVKVESRKAFLEGNAGREYA